MYIKIDIIMLWNNDEVSQNIHLLSCYYFVVKHHCTMTQNRVMPQHDNK